MQHNDSRRGPFDPRKGSRGRVARDAAGDPEPIFTGQFNGKTGGRITVFKKPSGQEYLRLRDLTVPGDADAHVELAKSGDVSQALHAGQAAFDGIDHGCGREMAN